MSETALGKWTYWNIEYIPIILWMRKIKLINNLGAAIWNCARLGVGSAQSSWHMVEPGPHSSDLNVALCLAWSWASWSLQTPTDTVSSLTIVKAIILASESPNLSPPTPNLWPHPHTSWEAHLLLPEQLQLQGLEARHSPGQAHRRDNLCYQKRCSKAFVRDYHLIAMPWFTLE